MYHISPNMQAKSEAIYTDIFRYLDIDGTITSPILESLIGKSLACKNIFIDTLVVQVTGDSLMMYQLH